jgi:hypothetical protein
MAQDKPTQSVTHNVQLTFHLIEADGFQGDDPEIAAVVTELRKVFRFQGYRLLSTSVLHATANPGSSVSQKVADDQGRAYSIAADVGAVGGDARPRLTATSLALNVRLGLVQQGSSYTGLIDASVRLQDGRTVVLGSARLSGQSGALILAVTPTIDR